MGRRGRKSERTTTPPKRSSRKASAVALTRFNSITLGYIALALIGVAFAYFLPAQSAHICASEVPTNGRGVSVNLAAKTLKLEAQGDAVPLEKISDRSAVVIDTMSRLCRERERGRIQDKEYKRRFNQVMQPIVAAASASPAA